MESEPITAIFFSCRRLHLLRQSLESFIENNSYPLKEIIIVNDSADPSIHDRLRKYFSDYRLILNKENVGLFKSIDIGYAEVQTPWAFHCEDDWMVIKDGLIEKSLKIMKSRSDIEEVWTSNLNNHGVESQILYADDVPYKLAMQDINKGIDGYDKGWHGFSTACCLKRLADYKRIAPYGDINYRGSWKHGVTAWHKEYAIGLEYYKLGYRTAVLIDDEYAVNIGIGQSEYVCGKSHKI